MDPRALIAVISAVLAVVLGPHMFLLLGFTLAATVLLAAGYGIARVAAETGMGVIPVVRPRVSRSWLPRCTPRKRASGSRPVPCLTSVP